MDFPSHLQRWSDSLSVTRWYLLRNAHQGRSTSGEGTREHRVKHSKAYLEAFVFNVSGLCGCSLSTRHRRLVYHLSSVQVTPVRTHPRHPPFPYGHLLTLMGFWAGALSFAPRPQARVTASYLMKPRNTSMIKLTSQPAVAKALGMVSAPVPTMRLNMYTSPTWSQGK